jgi:hypothetical protein
VEKKVIGCFLYAHLCFSQSMEALRDAPKRSTSLGTMKLGAIFSAERKLHRGMNPEFGLTGSNLHQTSIARLTSSWNHVRRVDQHPFSNNKKSDSCSQISVALGFFIWLKNNFIF